MLRDDELEELARETIDIGFGIHDDLGPGLLENAYEALLIAGMERRGIAAQRQISVPMRYKGVVVDNAFRIDVLVGGRLVVELGSVERLMPVHGKQVLTYLRLMNLPLGLLMNFGEPIFKSGLKRVANNYYGRVGKG
jgi:iron complex transport system substrate-binding protein